jgi:hypothetical protein
MDNFRQMARSMSTQHGLAWRRQSIQPPFGGAALVSRYYESQPLLKGILFKEMFTERSHT